MARILIITPHADDEVIGCGGMITKRKDAEIDVVVVALGNPITGVQAGQAIRENEMICAHESLGISSTSVLYYNRSGFLDEVPMFDIVGVLDKEIDKGYDEIFYPAACHMHDHAIVNQACRAALRPGAHRPMPYLVAEYEHNWPGWSSVDGGCMYVDITEQIDDKITAMDCYESQLKRHLVPHHPLSTEAILTVAQMRGLECGCAYAERYRIVYAFG